MWYDIGLNPEIEGINALKHLVLAPIPRASNNEFPLQAFSFIYTVGVSY